jgi:hypothetical protein
MQDIESKATFSQQQLAIVKAQMAAKQRDIRLLQLTAKELEGLPAKTKVYEGVGKMLVSSVAISLFPPSLHGRGRMSKGRRDGVLMRRVKNKTGSSRKTCLR